MQKVIKLFFGLLIFVSSTGFAKAENLLWSMSFFCDEGVSFEFSEVETRDLLSTRTKNGRTLSLKLKRSTNDDNIFSSKNGNVNGTLKRSDKTSAKVSAYFTQNNKNNSVLSPNFGKMTATLSGRGTIESDEKIGGLFSESSDDESTDEFLTHDCTVTGKVKQVVNYVSNTQKRKACRGAISTMGVLGWASTTYSQPFIEKSKALGLSPEDCAAVLGRTDGVVASKPKSKSVPFEWSDNDGNGDLEERRRKTAKARRQAEKWERRRQKMARSKNKTNVVNYSSAVAKRSSILWSMNFDCEDADSFSFSRIRTSDLSSFKNNDGKEIALAIKKPSNLSNIFSGQEIQLSGSVERTNGNLTEVWGAFKLNNTKKSQASLKSGNRSANLKGSGSWESEDIVTNFGGYKKVDCLVTGSVQEVINYDQKPKPEVRSAKNGAEEEKRRQELAEAKRKAEEEKRRQALAEAKRKAEEEKRRQALAEAKRKAEEEKRLRELAEAKRKAEEQERRRVELAEAMRKAEEVERRRKEVAEAKRKAEEVERRRLQLAEIKRKAEEEERRLNKLMAELAEEKRKAEEEERRRVELAEARRARDIEEQKLKRMKEELELKLKALASAKDQGSERSQSGNITAKSKEKKSSLVNSDKGQRKANSLNRHAVAVIIGNRDYKGKTGDVDFAERDAQAMRDFVVNKLNYREGNIIDLRNATQAELRTTFGSKDMHKGKLYNYVRAGKSDVVVFYSGHGVPGLKDRRGYLLPVDGEPNLAELSAYSIDILLKNLAKIPARSITVFLDACFSGDSPKGMIVRATSGLSVEIKRPKTVDAKMVVITASKDDQFASWDEDAKHGLFTKHIIEGLSGVADSADFQGNGDGKVTVGELKAYLDDEMSYQARRRFNRDQNATVRGNLKTVLSAY